MDRTNIWILAVLGGVVLVLLIVPFAMMGGMGDAGMWGMDGPMMGFPIGMLLFGLLPIALLVLIVVVLVRLLAPGTRGAGPERALDILDRRYASGEIGREEYERMRADLGPRT
ncbi:MAG: SHOCT domain-containing protein [Candidatus Limnocylindria bacterium]